MINKWIYESKHTHIYAREKQIEFDTDENMWTSISRINVDSRYNGNRWDKWNKFHNAAAAHEKVCGMFFYSENEYSIQYFIFHKETFHASVFRMLPPAIDDSRKSQQFWYIEKFRFNWSTGNIWVLFVSAMHPIEWWY